MNTLVKGKELEAKIWTVGPENFTTLALEIFQYQYQHNPIYQQFCNLTKQLPANIERIEQIPFLPINCFKTHKVITGSFQPQVIFESSGTTQTINSKHLVKDTGLYQRSFESAFEQFYGATGEYCILALLPSYLERNNSSLVMMADRLILKSGHPLSGFYLNNTAALHAALKKLENSGQKTMLLGVTFALLDFAEAYAMPLHYTTIIETGGMKGRREEMIREDVHNILCLAFGVQQIHSEYGMTELLSQSYATSNGVFKSPAWKKIVIREEDDPFAIHALHETPLSGALNIIDLANLYSCSFIATEDAGRLYPDGSFEVLGRLDHSDIRGCSLMAIR